MSIFLFQIELNCLAMSMATDIYVKKKKLERKKEYLSCKHAFNAFFFFLLIKNNIVCMSAGFPSNTHKQYEGTVFPSNAR